MEKNYINSVFKSSSHEDELKIRAFTLFGYYLIQIEREMETHGISKKELAHSIDVSPSYLSQLFNYQKLANFKILAKIEKALHIEFAPIISSDIDPTSEVSNALIQPENSD